jgi:Tfp pilus assembly protein PilX
VKKRRQSGFLVVTALMILIVLVLLGMGFLGSQANRYRSVISAAQAAQARQLAMAGLEDARIKMQNDLDFPPPPAGPDQTSFSYCENMTLGPVGQQLQGNYQVIINTAYATDPYWVFEVQSVGSLGDPLAPSAQYVLTGEIDVDPSRVGVDYCRFTHISDDSSL